MGASDDTADGLGASREPFRPLDPHESLRLLRSMRLALMPQFESAPPPDAAGDSPERTRPPDPEPPA